MSDYIDRENYCKTICRCDREYCDKEKCPIWNAPAADVRPVVRGRWEPGNQNCTVCGESKFKGLDADVWADWMPPFCPNCGADMRGE